MGKVLYAKPVREEILTEVKEKMKALTFTPVLGIIRVGENSWDLSYEKGLKKTAAEIGAEVVVKEFSKDASEDEIIEGIKEYNDKDEVRGILVFRPLPKTLDEDKIAEAVDYKKDVDSMCKRNLAEVFLGNESGHYPITPQGAIKILEHYGYEFKGRKALVINRSPVVGRPLVNLLLNRNATVTIAHTKTVDIKKEIQNSDYVFLATGQGEKFTADYFKGHEVICDIGINVNKEGKLCGDLNPDAFSKVAAYTPVPGGVGAITNLLLFNEMLKY